MSPLTYKSPTLFVFYCRGIVFPVSPLSTIHGREVQHLDAPYPTVRLSPWRQVRKTSIPGCGPLRGHPCWFPLVSSDWGIWASPLEIDQDPIQGAYPWYNSIMSPPRRASRLVPLPLELRASLPLEVAHYLLCFFGVTPSRVWTTQEAPPLLVTLSP